MAQDLRLIIFSLALQAAIGTMIALMITGKLTGKYEYIGASIASAGLGIVGFLAFVLNLGRPSFIFNALSQFGHSWLSRELIFTLLFIGLALIHVVVQYVNPAIKRFGWSASVIGLLDILLMVAVYMSTSRLGWQGLTTLIDFAATSAILGAALFLSIHLKDIEAKAKKAHSLDGLASIAILAMTTVLIYTRLDTEKIGLSLGIHLLLLILGAVLLFIPSLKTANDKAGSFSTGRAYLGAVALVAGLVVSRYLFYVILVAGPGL